MNKQRSYDDATITVYTPELQQKKPSVETKERSDLINHPSHYNVGIECWDYILSHKMGFLEGNIIKYITRYKQKNGKADLLKAKEYLNKLIDDYEKAKD